MVVCRIRDRKSQEQFAEFEKKYGKILDQMGIKDGGREGVFYAVLSLLEGNDPGKNITNDEIFKKLYENRQAPFEVSTAGDDLGRKFSAYNAKFSFDTQIKYTDADGKQQTFLIKKESSVELAYQRAKGYTTIDDGKGKNPKKRSVVAMATEKDIKNNMNSSEATFWNVYLPIWRAWAAQNEELLEQLWDASLAQGKYLNDQFASSGGVHNSVNQARALTVILNEKFTPRPEATFTLLSPNAGQPDQPVVTLSSEGQKIREAAERAHAELMAENEDDDDAETNEKIDKEKKLAEKLMNSDNEVGKAFTPAQRRGAAKAIAIIFGEAVDELMEEEAEAIDEKIRKMQEDRSKKLPYRELLGIIALKQRAERLRDGSMTERKRLMREKGGSAIIKKVGERLKQIRSITDEREKWRFYFNIRGYDAEFNDNSLAKLGEEWKKQAVYAHDLWSRILTNDKVFIALVSDAMSIIKRREPVSFRLSSAAVMEEAKPVTESKEGEENGEDHRSDDVREESDAEIWMEDFEAMDTRSSLSQFTRETLEKVRRREKHVDKETGEVWYEDVPDEFGLPELVPVDESVSALNTLFDEEEVLDSSEIRPAIEKLRETHPWADSLIDFLDEDDSFVTALWQGFRRDDRNYYVQFAAKGGPFSKAIKIIAMPRPSNRDERPAAWVAAWRRNIEDGVILDKNLSVYDENGKIIKEKREELINKLTQLETKMESYEHLLLYKFKERNTPEGEQWKDGYKQWAAAVVPAMEECMKAIGIDPPNRMALEDMLSTTKKTQRGLATYADILKTNMLFILNKTRDWKSDEFARIFDMTTPLAMAKRIARTHEGVVEDSASVNGKRRFVHQPPSYITTLLKKLRGRHKEETVYELYKKYPWFYDEKTRTWYNTWLWFIEKSDMSASVSEEGFALGRDWLEHKILLENHEGLDYSQWSDRDYLLVLITEYFNQASRGKDVAYYPVPVLSDVNQAQFVSFKRFDYKTIIDGLKLMAYQEMKRINLVRQRAEKIRDGKIKPIANFDMTFNKDGTVRSYGGAEFKFLPFLNGTVFDPREENFFMNDDEDEDNEAKEKRLVSFIKVKMEELFAEEYERYKKLGVLETVTNAMGNTEYKFFAADPRKRGVSVVEPFSRESTRDSPFQSSAFAKKRYLHDLKEVIKAVEAENNKNKGEDEKKIDASQDLSDEKALELLNKLKATVEAGSSLVIDTKLLDDTADNPTETLDKLGAYLDRKKFTIEKLVTEFDDKKFENVETTQNAVFKSDNLYASGVDFEDEDSGRNVHSRGFNNPYDRDEENDVGLALYDDSVTEFFREFFYNEYFASKNLIQLLETDLAFFPNTNEFVKRNKQVYSSGLRLDTQARMDGERVGSVYERSITVADEEIASAVIEDMKKVVEKAREEGRMSDNDAAQILAAYGYSNTADGKYCQIGKVKFRTKKINVTDGQAFRTLESYRKVMVMCESLKWTAELEEAYNRIKKGMITFDDITLFMQSIKPFVFTHASKTSGVDDTAIKVPIQRKNSESVLLAVYDAVAQSLGSASRLKALNRFMLDNDIDTVQFVSAVKVGAQGVVDLNGAKDYNSVYNTLEDALRSGPVDEDGDWTENEEIVHTTPYEDYMIQVETPESHLDKKELFGTQLMKLIFVDMEDGMKVTVDGKTFTKKELSNLYQSALVENILERYNELMYLFKDEKRVSALIMDEVRRGDYDEDIAKATLLNADGKFNLPLYDPVQSKRVQQLLLSCIRNRLQRQKTAGGALIQVTSWGLDDSLRIVFNEDGGIKYMECYMPAMARKFFEPLMKDDGTLDVNKLPDDLRKCIGYRLPTEHLCSVWPLYIKGFLPAANGSAIMLPAEITTISGTDFDVDETHIMFPASYKDKAGNLHRVKPDIKKKPKDMTRAQRDNLVIDIIWGILTHKNTAARSLNPGGFAPHKRAVRVCDILSCVTSKELKEHTGEDTVMGAIRKLKEMDVDELQALYDEISAHKSFSDISLPTSQLYYHSQNMNVKGLVGVYANANVVIAMLQLTEARLADYVIKEGLPFGKTLGSLHDARNADGQYVTKIMSGYLGASVDNAKEPLLASLNQNKFTANVTCLLTALGYSPLEVGAFLNQPIIKEMTEAWKTSESHSKKGAIKAVLEKYKTSTPKKDTWNTLDTALYCIMAKNEEETMSDDREAQMKAIQYQYGLMFERMYDLAAQFTVIVQGMRSGSYRGTVGKSIATTKMRERSGDSLVDLIQREGGKKTPPIIGLSGLLRHINLFDWTDSDELREELLKGSIASQQAFYTLCFEGTSVLLSKYFPQFSALMDNAVKQIANQCAKKLTDTEMEMIYNDFLLYLATNLNFFNSQDEKNGSSYYQNKFPLDFRSTIRKRLELKDNALIRALAIEKKVVDGKEYKILMFPNNGKLSADQKKRIKDAWQDLYEDNNTNPLAKMLFLYCFYRNGFTFGGGTFTHMAPVALRMGISGYRDLLYSFLDTARKYSQAGADYNVIADVDNNITSFVQQFILNHLSGEFIARQVDSSAHIHCFEQNDNDLIVESPKIKDTLKLDASKMNDFQKAQFVKNTIQERYRSTSYFFHSYLAFNTGEGKVYYVLDSEESSGATAVYHRVTNPLGVKGLFLEYAYGVRGEAMATKIKGQDVSDGMFGGIDAIVEDLQEAEMISTGRDLLEDDDNTNSATDEEIADATDPSVATPLEIKEAEKNGTQLTFKQAKEEEKKKDCTDDAGDKVCK